MKEHRKVPDLYIEKLILDELPKHEKEQLLKDPQVRRRVAELQAENPGTDLVLLVGADILGELHRWHRVEEVAQRAQLAVMSRADSPMVEAKVDVDLVRVEVTHIAVSSSDVRERVRAGRPYRFLVPGPVYDIIEAHSLYRNQTDEE